METLTNTNVSENVVNKLIDKISDSIEWVATHDTPKRIAVNSLIEDVKKSNLDPVEKAAYISNAKQIIKDIVIKATYLMKRFLFCKIIPNQKILKRIG